MEALSTDVLEERIQELPSILQHYCSDYAATLSQSSSSYSNLTAIISKLSLPMLSSILPALVRDAQLAAAVMVVDIAMQMLPQSALLQSWLETLHTAAAQKQPDTAAVLSALQPFVPTDLSSKADCARLHFYENQPSVFAEIDVDEPLGMSKQDLLDWYVLQHLQHIAKVGTGSLDILEPFNRVLAMSPQDASYAANLARRGCMKICDFNDRDGGLADLKAADQISPIQDFHQLKLLGEFGSNADPAYAVKIFDRMLCLKPVTYPAREAYGRTFQQRGACKSTLQQYDEALEDLRMAIKLGDAQDDNAKKTLRYMRDAYINKVCAQTRDARVVVDMLNAAYAKDPEDQALLMACRIMCFRLREVMGDKDYVLTDADWDWTPIKKRAAEESEAALTAVLERITRPKYRKA